ncbi:MAG: hypothetical protein SOZ62_03270 [Eubacteriales bacterium]|nr:hypothetical protein [Eubacteriales bacterium]
MCLCYGNDLYTPEGKKVYGSMAQREFLETAANTGCLDYICSLIMHIQPKTDLTITIMNTRNFSKGMGRVSDYSGRKRYAVTTEQCRSLEGCLPDSS